VDSSGSIWEYNLLDGRTLEAHLGVPIVLIVVFKTRLDEDGEFVPNNFVVTGWAKYIRPKG